MAGNNRDVLPGADIQTERTPEELAKELETKSHENLAKKIRQLAEEAKSNGKGARETLREGLTPEEQAEIREALPGDIGVAQVFDKGMTPNEAGKVAIDGALKGKTEKKNKGLSFFDKISSLGSRFANAGEIFDKIKNAKGGFGGWVAGIGAWFAYMFTGKIPELPEGVSLSFLKNTKGKVEDKVEGGKDILKDKDLQYIGGIKSLFLLKGEKKNDFTISILNLDEIKSKSFSDLKDEYKKGEKGIGERLKISNKGSDKQIYKSLKLFIDNEDFLDKTIGKGNKEWKSGKIGENLIDLGKMGSGMINKIVEKVENTSFSINPADAMKQLSSISMFEIGTENGKINFGDLEEREGLFKDISGKTLITLISMSDKLKGTPDEKNRMLSSAQDDKEKQFIEQLFEFRGKIITLLSGLFGEGDIKKEYNKFFSENGLTMKQLLELYLITGGNTDINSLNGLEKSAIYLKLWKILGDNPSFRGKYFDKKLIEGIKEGTIPEDVKMVLGNIFGKIADAFISGTTKALKELYEAIPLEWKIGVGLAIGTLIIAMVYFKPIAIVGQVAIVSILTTAVMKSSTINKETGKVYTEAEIKKIVSEALEQYTK
ncbi:MAG: hypothetical protein PHE25_00205 [Candidatus Gracilibacteria bacterium]|nr:hypothetical protein [Candidatus Gracilibacteria bacterium]